MLHFFGSIDAEHTSHEIRGLNVIVRLAKSSVDWAWPQLTAENVKMHWLSYDYNAIKTDDIYLDKGETGKLAARNWLVQCIQIEYFVLICFFSVYAIEGDFARVIEDIDSDDIDSDSDEFED